MNITVKVRPYGGVDLYVLVSTLGEITKELIL